MPESSVPRALSLSAWMSCACVSLSCRRFVWSSAWRRTFSRARAVWWARLVSARLSSSLKRWGDPVVRRQHPDRLLPHAERCVDARSDAARHEVRGDEEARLAGEVLDLDRLPVQEGVTGERLVRWRDRHRADRARRPPDARLETQQFIAASNRNTPTQSAARRSRVARTASVEDCLLLGRLQEPLGEGVQRLVVASLERELLEGPARSRWRPTPASRTPTAARRRRRRTRARFR